MDVQDFAKWACCCLVGVGALHFVCVLAAIFRFRKRSLAVPTAAHLPKTAVLLCLRGADPSLADTIRRLARQDYPAFALFIAVDSRTDPAWSVVKQVLKETGATNVHVSPLRNRLSTCSLKCSSLVQLLDQVDESFEAIALADADLECHSTWLQELVAPLAESGVGATFGNRWFLPSKGWMGSLVRQVTNAIGVVTMPTHQIAWAGSLAIRASVVRNGNLRDRLSMAVVDDGAVRVVVREQKLKLKFVPSLMMANREDCDLSFANSFLRRQFTWTRTYVGSEWPVMLLYSLTVLLLIITSGPVAVICWFTGHTQAAGLLGAALMVYSTLTIVSWLLLDLAVRRLIRRRGDDVVTIWSAQLIRIPLAMMISAWILLTGILWATFARRVTWRGVTYEVFGPWNTRVVDDRPFVPAAPATVGVTSVSI